MTDYHNSVCSVIRSLHPLPAALVIISRSGRSSSLLSLSLSLSLSSLSVSQTMLAAVARRSLLRRGVTPLTPRFAAAYHANVQVCILSPSLALARSLALSLSLTL